MSLTTEIADALGEVVDGDSLTVTHSSGTFTARRNRGEGNTKGMDPDGYLPQLDLQLLATVSALGSLAPAINDTLTVSAVVYRIVDIHKDAAAWLFKCNRQN